LVVAGKSLEPRVDSTAAVALEWTVGTPPVKIDRPGGIFDFTERLERVSQPTLQTVSAVLFSLIHKKGSKLRPELESLLLPLAPFIC
jgi:hypothetical protein